jgi:hypothetical protein
VIRRPEEQDLELIPRVVRDKLDRVGIKLHLKDWGALTRAERATLCELPCDNDAEVRDYAAAIEAMVLRVTGKAAERIPGPPC